MKREDEERLDDVGDDIGGCKKAMAQIREMIDAPLSPATVQDPRCEATSRSSSLWPSRKWKTLNARAVANEIGAFFFLINGPEIMEKWQVRRSPIHARPSRGREEQTRMVSQLLTLMDGMKGRGQTVIIRATNRLNSIVAALRRFGRFDRELNIGVNNHLEPQGKARKARGPSPEMLLTI